MSQDALDLLLSGVRDQGQRKQITSAYYAFANGDPETFAVQFAVLLRAHAVSLKLLPARLEKSLSAETGKLGDLVIAHQNSVQRMASLLDQALRKNGVGEAIDACLKIQRSIQSQLATHGELLTRESEKIDSAVVAQGKLVQRLATHRILLTVILSYVMGLLTVPILREVLSFFGPMLH
jgi:hypothetical protein